MPRHSQKPLPAQPGTGLREAPRLAILADRVDAQHLWNKGVKRDSLGTRDSLGRPDILDNPPGHRTALRVSLLMVQPAQRLLA